MQTQILRIDTADGRVTAPSPIIGLIGTTLKLRCSFITAGRPDEIASLTSGSIRFGLKDELSLDAASSLVGLGVWNTTGAGHTARYEFEVAFDSADLRDIMGSDQVRKTLWAQIAWAIDGEDTERRSHPFQVIAVAGITEFADLAPNPNDDAAFVWLQSRLPQGLRLNRTVNTGAQTITFSGIGASYSRKSSDVNCYTGAYTDIFTFAVEANKIYRLDAKLEFSVNDGHAMVVRGFGPTGSNYYGKWNGIYNEGGYLKMPLRYDFFGTDYLIDARFAGSNQSYAPAVQSFLIYTGSTPGNLILQAQGTASGSGVLKSGSWGQLTEIG